MALAGLHGDQVKLHIRTCVLRGAVSCSGSSGLLDKVRFELKFLLIFTSMSIEGHCGIDNNSSGPMLNHVEREEYNIKGRGGGGGCYHAAYALVHW